MPVDQVIRPPAAEPLHLDEVKAHLRVTGTDEDSLIEALTAAARQHVETYCRRALIRQSRKLVRDAFPWRLELPVSPLRTVEALTYVDTSGTEQTLSASLYRVDAHSDTPRIEPVYGGTWPSIRDVTNAVAVQYAAGYAVPFTADAATNVLAALGHDLSDGDEVTLYNSGGALPAGLSAATPYYVVSSSANALSLSATAGGAAVDITDAGSGQSFIGLVPRPILQAMLLLIGHLYENREAVNVGNIVNEMPYAVDALLAPYRVLRF